MFEGQKWRWRKNQEAAHDEKLCRKKKKCQRVQMRKTY